MILQRTLVQISGDNATAFLNRMLTQNLVPESTGQYGFLLEANGQLISGAFWLFRSHSWWGITHPDMAEPLVEGLQKYVFFRDAVNIRIAGPHTVTLTESTEGAFIDSGIASVVSDWTESTNASADPNPLDRRRAGVPVLGIEVRPGDNVLEWDMGYGLAQKGCYVGQEIIERMWSRARRARGRVNVEATEALTDQMTVQDEQFGTLEVRSPVYCSQSERWLALGLCRTLPGIDQPWRTTSGLTIRNPATGHANLPRSLSAGYSAWATGAA